MRLLVIGVVALFVAALVDFWVLRSIGIRLFPVSYGSIRTVFYALAAATLGITVAGIRSRAEVFRVDVRWHRVVVLLCVPVMVGTALGFIGGAWWLADLFAHFRLQYLVTLTAGTFALAALRAWRQVWMLALFAIVNAIVVLPHVVPEPPSPVGSDRSRVLRLVLANVNVSNENPELLLRFLASADADVIVLQEVNDRWVGDVAILDESHPHTVAAPSASPFGIALWSRLPLRSAEIVHLVGEAYPTLVVRIEVRGESVRVVTSHPNRPRDKVSAARRDRHLDGMARLAKDAREHAIILGDLNTTPWGHAFRRLTAEAGLLDSSRWAGLNPTWPVGSLLFAMPIDHALYTPSLERIDHRLGPPIDSDHYPLIVDFGVEASGQS